MYQPSLAFFEESLGWPRPMAVLLMVGICLVGSFLVMYYSIGGIFWSTIDDWVGTFLIFILAMVQIIAFSWVFGIKKGLQEAHRGAQLRIGPFYSFVMKYVTPTYLLVVFGAFCYQNLSDWLKSVADEPLRQGALVLVGATTLILVVCTAVGERRWRVAGLDIDGKLPVGDEKGARR
jgi:hypothetical protein